MKKLLLLLALVSGVKLSAQYSSMNVTGVKVPKYMASGNTNRMPVIARLQLTGLDPNTNYQYSTRGLTAADLSLSSNFAGAGNALFIDTSTWRYNTNGSVSFGTAVTIDTFKTDPGGNYEGWFSFVNTGNNRFKAGNYVYMGITIRGGSFTTDTFRWYCSDSIRVLSFSSSNAADTSGTAAWGKSMAAQRNIIALYDNILGNDRPLVMTYAESESISVGSTPRFYIDSVNGRSGNWGAIIPNTNSNGVRRIENLSLRNGQIVYANQDNDGVWGPNAKNTINPSGGTTTPIALGLDDAALTAPVVEFWSRTSTRNEGDGIIQAFVTRRFSNDADQSVRIFVSGGTATKGSGGDYTLTEPRVITFKPGARANDTAKITLFDDNTAEGDETIVLRIDQASNCVIGTEVAHTITIKDNDIPNLVLGPKTVVVKENANRIGVKIKMDKAVTTASSIRLFVKRQGDSTRIPGEFKLGRSNTDSVFNLGKSTGADSVTIFSSVFDEFVSDPNDTVVLCVRQLSGSAALTDSLFTLVMTDNDGPSQIRFLNSSLTVNETQANFRARVLVVAKSDATADFTLSFLSGKSTATDGSDFNFGTAQITTIDNTTPDTIDFTVPLINDNLFELAEQAVFVINNMSNTTILKPDTLKVRIISEDLPQYTIGRIRTQSNANRTADSLNVRCRITGTVHTGNLRSGGLSFMMADNTGGIGVFAPSKTFGYSPKEGDSVLVQGRVGQFQGLAQMDFLDTIIFIAGNRPLRNATLVTDFDENSENTLVQVRRVKLVDPSEWPSSALSPNGFKNVRIQFTNGQIDTLSIDAETDIDGSAAPAGYLNITGIGQQFDGSSPFTARYMLTPRKLADFQPASLPRINFFKRNDTITELADSFRFELQVLPTDENFTFDVRVIGGTATSPQDYDFNGRTLTVLKNNSYYSGRANISDDNLSDGPKTLIFGIRNIVGPGSTGPDSTLTLLITDNEASSVKSFATGSLKMFPNPATNHVVVEGQENILNLEISDLNGRVIYSQTNAGRRIETTLQASAGIYMVKVTTASGMFADKLIIK